MTSVCRAFSVSGYFAGIFQVIHQFDLETEDICYYFLVNRLLGCLRYRYCGEDVVQVWGAVVVGRVLVGLLTRLGR